MKKARMSSVVISGGNTARILQASAAHQKLTRIGDGSGKDGREANGPLANASNVLANGLWVQHPSGMVRTRMDAYRLRTMPQAMTSSLGLLKIFRKHREFPESSEPPFTSGEEFPSLNVSVGYTPIVPRQISNIGRPIFQRDVSMLSVLLC